ncbi:hypothetical protein VP1G_06434 [Cytospora mali]|uniref:Rhodopsin domain-containing protein n=1 Tax=Cytospora mali TaxID=578113 RepID=A0A194V5L0_CYTMA|nr:hypothetical protein VP1G_06434 [Valsa mali var. pyri (nom. inval.)]
MAIMDIRQLATLALRSEQGGVDSRQNIVYAINVAFMALITVMMGIRMYVRMVISRKVGLDDILMVIGTIFTFGLSIASIIAATYGVGRHVADIPLENVRPMLQTIYSTRLLYIAGMSFVKVALLVFYLRLDPRRPMRLSLYVFIGGLTAFNIISFFILAFSCTPPAMFWGDQVPGGKCMAPESQLMFYNVNGILNIIIDLGIYLVPIPMLWAIKMPLRQKLGVIGIFALGLLSVAAGCVRFAYVLLLSNTTDQYYFLADSLNWCSIEIYVAVMCSCATAFKVLIKKHFPRIFGSSNASAGGHKFSKPGGSRSFGSKAPKDAAYPSMSSRWTKIPSTKQVGVSGSGRRTSNESEIEMVRTEIMRKTEIRVEFSDENVSQGSHT